MSIGIKRLIVFAGASLLTWAISTSVEAGVDVNINIGLPPPVVVQAPPAMIFLAEPGIYVAVGIPYDIFFISGRYYYFHSGNWFWAPGYGGPWVQAKSLPTGLQKYKIKQLHEFREREYKAYKTQGPKYKGRQFVAAKGQSPKANAPMKTPQVKEGKAKGREK